MNITHIAQCDKNPEHKWEVEQVSLTPCGITYKPTDCPHCLTEKPKVRDWECTECHLNYPCFVLHATDVPTRCVIDTAEPNWQPLPEGDKVVRLSKEEVEHILPRINNPSCQECESIRAKLGGGK